MLKIRKVLKNGKFLAEVYDANGHLLATDLFDTDTEALDWFSALSAALLLGFRNEIERL